MAARTLDTPFPFTFTCAYLPRRVSVRLYYCVRTMSMWVFVARPDGSPLEFVRPWGRPVLHSASDAT